MKQKSKSAAIAAIAAIATALTASLAPVPAKSTILPTTVIESGTHARVVSMLTFEHHDGQVFLPLEEAIEYINGLNDNMRAALNAVIEERQNRGKGALFTDKTAKIIKICEESLKQHTRVKEAVKIVMDPDNLAKCIRIAWSKESPIAINWFVLVGQLRRGSLSLAMPSTPSNEALHQTKRPAWTIRCLTEM